MFQTQPSFATIKKAFLCQQKGEGDKNGQAQVSHNDLIIAKQYGENQHHHCFKTGPIWGQGYLFLFLGLFIQKQVLVMNHNISSDVQYFSLLNVC